MRKIVKVFICYEAHQFWHIYLCDMGELDVAVHVVGIHILGG